jgi:two-component system LytT family sensor kinase
MSSQQTNNLFYFLFGFEKTKGKLNQVLLVLIHIMAWCFIFLLPLLFYPLKYERSNFFLREILSKTALVALFYSNYYYLLPRFFEKKKYILYFLLVITFILIILIWDISLYHLLLNPDVPLNNGNPIIPFNNAPFSIHEKIIWGIPQSVFFTTVNRVLSFAFILLLTGALMRLGLNYIKNQQEKKALENAHLNAEINLLKSQINPHFLFNTLNGIYALAHEKSGKTEVAILKLSEMLRYMLYESPEEKADLSKEILYITNYIELQRMRLSDKVKINFEVSGKAEGLHIVPFLLITFIENAFKHGVSYAKPGNINVQIDIFEKTLTLFVENPYPESDSFTAIGLGLKNAERRLELLYPGKYSLQSGKKEDSYIVNLKLELSD